MNLPVEIDYNYYLRERVVEIPLYYYKTNSQIYDEFLIRVTKHVYYMRHFGKELNVLENLSNIHDWSNWEINEFPWYAKYFCDGKQEKDKPPFAKAWLHHVHNNPHHWEHWCLPNNYSFGDAINGCLKMPSKYVLEMVADWLGASYQYTGSVDMTKWLDENLPKIKLHPESKKVLSKILGSLGYETKLYRSLEK